jgi:hypothetical protein
MLRVSNSELKLTSQGYHFDENGKKFVRIFTSLNFIKIQIKIQRHKEMHIKSISTDFPYTITDNWVEMIFPYQDIEQCNNAWMAVDNYIDKRCEEVWFV